MITLVPLKRLPKRWILVQASLFWSPCMDPKKGSYRRRDWVGNMGHRMYWTTQACGCGFNDDRRLRWVLGEAKP